MTANRYDLVVVGAGIAGLAIAEMFARNGRCVVLIERNTQVCQEASASQHSWFHFGSLYSMFPQNHFLRTLVGGVEDLLEHYPFPAMNLSVNTGGNLRFAPSPDAWFRDEPIEYLVSARNNPDFDMRRFEGLADYSKKLFFLGTWELAIKQFISRHQRFEKHNWLGNVPASRWIPKAGFADYSRDVIHKPQLDGLALDPDTHFSVMGYDRPMRSIRIATDLLRSFLGSGGELTLGTTVEKVVRDGTGHAVHAGGRVYVSDHVMAAPGKWLGELMPDRAGVKVVASPLLVAWPAVSQKHFVRMTPFVEKSVNHLHHMIDGQSYSVIGSGHSAAPDNAERMAWAGEKLIEMAGSVFPALADAHVKETYFGYKTELVAQAGERNYQYVIRDVEQGLSMILPGKFSLCFSTAVNAFKRTTGESPTGSPKLVPESEVAGLVSLTRHAQIVRDGIGMRVPSMTLDRKKS